MSGDTWGALAQVAPTATTLTDAYTVPASRHATVEVVICNRGAGSITVRVAHAVAGEADAIKHYLLYDYAVAPGDAKTTSRITLSATDVIRVYASSGDATFNINGIEEAN